MDKYIINQGDFQYIKDSLSERQLLIEQTEKVQWLPSSGKDFTLFSLNNGDFYYSRNSEFIQVFPEEQQVDEDEIELEKKSVKK